MGPAPKPTSATLPARMVRKATDGAMCRRMWWWWWGGGGVRVGMARMQAALPRRWAGSCSCQCAFERVPFGGTDNIAAVIMAALGGPPVGGSARASCNHMSRDARRPHGAFFLAPPPLLPPSPFPSTPTPLDGGCACTPTRPQRAILVGTGRVSPDTWSSGPPTSSLALFPGGPSALPLTPPPPPPLPPPPPPTASAPLPPTAEPLGRPSEGALAGAAGGAAAEPAVPPCAAAAHMSTSLLASVCTAVSG
jgi:hypothetical protein